MWKKESETGSKKREIEIDGRHWGLIVDFFPTNLIVIPCFFFINGTITLHKKHSCCCYYYFFDIFIECEFFEIVKKSC